MTVEVIEGTAQPSRAVKGRGKYGRLENWQIVTSSGQVRDFRRIAVAEPLRSEVAAGATGRFTIIKADGVFGLVGLRRPDGAGLYAHHMNVEPMILVVGLLGTACAIAKFAFGVAELPWLASVLGPPLLFGWWYLRGQRLAGRRAYEADEGR